MREVPIRDPEAPLDTESFLACVATILELDLAELSIPATSGDPAADWTLSRWLAGLGVGLVRIADPESFSWSGPWIARIKSPEPASRRSVVMYGVPSGVVWDPAERTGPPEGRIVDGFLLAATDIALAMPAQASAPNTPGVVEAIAVAPAAGEPARLLEAATALSGQGLDGDRHVSGKGTFPSGTPGSALTLIEAEVCESFDPPLEPNEHRRNIVTRGIDLNRLVGHRFKIGEVNCVGMRLCEPCTVVDGYSRQPVLRPLVHRGGLRADILDHGEIRVGDPVRPLP